MTSEDRSAGWVSERVGGGVANGPSWGSWLRNACSLI